MRQTIDVLVVGAGPTGSTLAIDLARRGLSVRLIEKNPQGFPGSRAKGLQPRTLEVFEDLGVLQSVQSAGALYPPLGIHLGPFTLPKRMFKTRRPSDDTPYPNTWLIPQYQTDSILHQRLAELRVRIEFNSRLVSFSQNDDFVLATIEQHGGETQIACKFMVGADGGGSTVREKLGVSFPGKTDEGDRIIIADCEVDGLSRNYWHAWLGRRGRFTAACPLPGGDLFQWMIRLRPGEEPKLDEAALNERVRERTKSRKLRLHNIRWTSVFRPNIRLADHYCKGRVFIAGDAAHVHTPMGAQGLNTGVQDAYNLGWKLAQVLSGAPLALLESYEAERRPVAASVLGMSTAKYESMEKADSESMKRGKDEQQLLITYRAGPLGRAGQDRTATLAVGDRAPDAMLRDAHRAQVRLFALFHGPHFTAIAYGANAAQELAQIKWPHAGAALERVVIDGDASNEQTHVYRDTAASFKKIYGAESDTLFLIRPDGYIGQIAKRSGAAAIAKSISAFAPAQELAAASIGANANLTRQPTGSNSHV